MPNIRKKGKKLVSAWVPDKLHAAIRRTAANQDRTASDVIVQLLTDYADKHPLILRENANSNPPKPPIQSVKVERYTIPRSKPGRQT